MKNLELIMKFFILWAACSVFIYLCGSFIALDFDVTQWTDTGRFGLVVVVINTGLFLIGVYNLLKRHD